jgi:hypothetical protein
MIIMIKADETLVVAEPMSLTAKAKMHGHRVLQHKPTAIKA